MQTDAYGKQIREPELLRHIEKAQANRKASRAPRGKRVTDPRHGPLPRSLGPYARDSENRAWHSLVSTQRHEYRHPLRWSVRVLVPRVSLIRLLRAVCGAVEPLLRIEASEDCVTLAYGNIEAGSEANIERAGVCFLRHSKLKNLLQTYHADAGHSTTIEIEVRPSGHPCRAHPVFARRLGNLAVCKSRIRPEDAPLSRTVCARGTTPSGLANASALVSRLR